MVISSFSEECVCVQFFSENIESVHFLFKILLITYLNGDGVYLLLDKLFKFCFLKYKLADMGSRLKLQPDEIYQFYAEIRWKHTTTTTINDNNISINVVYPTGYSVDDETAKQLNKFCFPTGQPSFSSPERFCFVLTDQDGLFRFGFCRYDPVRRCCMFLLSYLPWFDCFYSFLLMLQGYTSNSGELIVMCPWFHFLHMYGVIFSPQVGKITSRIQNLSVVLVISYSESKMTAKERKSDCTNVVQREKEIFQPEIRPKLPIFDTFSYSKVPKIPNFFQLKPHFWDY